MKFSKVAACLVAAFSTAVLHADNARFDLVGPKIDVRVTRGSVTLPIAEVPNLQAGDKIWVKADLPSTQANHLLLIVAFLRGTTNEPPDNWFTKIETWDKKTAEGTTVTVPGEAEQAVIFIAPETGGDFGTLRSAVKGKPGLFIRADADLNEASFEQQRIERYLTAMKTVPTNDQKAIQDRSAKLAATLALKPNADCFKQPIEQQVNCLTQSSAPVLLDDGHGQGIAEALSTGPSSDFINAASYTQTAGAGLYSAYVGAVVDLVHLVSLMRTAQYQYIPGISFPQGSTLNLKLNAPPSFHKPESVIVVGLPAIQKAKLPPLHAHDPNQVACLLQPKMALMLEGAPLVFSTSFAHDLVLRLNRTEAPTDLPLTPEAFEGGLIVAKDQQRTPLGDAKPDAKPQGADAKPAGKTGSSGDLTITGTVHGYWGFDPFDGPTLTMQQVAGKGWKIVSDTQLLAGQDSHIALKADGTACVQSIALTNNKDKDVDVAFKPASGDKDNKDTLDLAVSLKKGQPGGYSLAIQQYGESAKSDVPLTAYTGDIHVDGLKIHKGDHAAVLRGQGLKDVVSVQIGEQTFTPANDGNDGTTVHLDAKSGVSPDDGSDALVKLKDGRTMTAKISTEAARPGLQLLSFNDTPAKQEGSLPVTLGAKNDIPLNGKLTLVVQTKDAFPRTQTIEVATADGSVHTSLSLATNDLMLQDEHTAIATLDPLKAFGQSAFGKLQMRPVAADGTTGDWTPLGMLVRTPQITAIQCATAGDSSCTAEGSNLFLVQAFGAAKDFANQTKVPTGFAETSFKVPMPADGTTVYLKLRDDPESVASVLLPTPMEKPAPAPAPTSPPPAAAAADPVASPESQAVDPAAAQKPLDTPAKSGTEPEKPAAETQAQPK
ncbi:hypothetical protein [Granulicella sibirica]|uniref:Uncharacterized protein n=1 Tax=Granulicella sibirica TaxID=2479048 RepID=A0A4Q0T812_9BACT|nr:hypothetical protein [Granulicella sibirica]RXH57846.1 hypothetical protein GRAN_1156 [Granulicella sibirica]